jgi:hypothetical protein
MKRCAEAQCSARAVELGAERALRRVSRATAAVEAVHHHRDKDSHA